MPRATSKTYFLAMGIKYDLIRNTFIHPLIIKFYRYLLIIPTLLQLYASHHTNKIVTRSIEYTIKQFYLMNRKPFILQMFGSASSILDLDDALNFEDSSRVYIIFSYFYYRLSPSFMHS